jgi:Mg/Co/Ni transporter MgtE
MSPRAAWRLEALGYPPVYDYVPGKMDWLSFGLPYEGEAVLAGRDLQRDVPTCRPHEKVAEVRSRLGPGAGACVALNDAGVVMGLVSEDSLTAASRARVEDVMDVGVSTVRPSEDLGELRARMRGAGVGAVAVTSSDGRLMGVVCSDPR